MNIRGLSLAKYIDGYTCVEWYFVRLESIITCSNFVLEGNLFLCRVHPYYISRLNDHLLPPFVPLKLDL